MDLGNPWMLMSGLLIGIVGMVLFNYGRKEADLKTLGVGVAMCVFPYFAATMLMLWLGFAALVGALYALHRWV